MAAATDKMVSCPVTTTIGVIGGKWRPRILWHLRQGPQRFGDLRRNIPRISERMLSRDLRDLEALGVVSRREFHDRAILATEYDFTEYGKTLIPALDALGDWGLDHQRRATGNGDPLPAAGQRQPDAAADQEQPADPGDGTHAPARQEP